MHARASQTKHPLAKVHRHVAKPTGSMSDSALPVLITVLGGRFSNQAAAFYALRAEAEKVGISVHPRETDVIREASEVRLAHYFRPAIVARIEAAMEDDDTAVLLFPSALTARPSFPPDESALRLVGRFAGLVTQPI